MEDILLRLKFDLFGLETVWFGLEGVCLVQRLSNLDLKVSCVVWRVSFGLETV